MAKKINKTNAMRILDSLHIAYEEIAYSIDDGHIDGHSVYKKVGMEPDGFFKTLVTRGKDNVICVFVIPVLKELDLKKAAKAAGEKNVAMIAVKELLGITGYIRGGCSPIGVKKKFATYFDQSIENIEKIFVSGGKQGLLIGTTPTDILQATEGIVADLTV